MTNIMWHDINMTSNTTPFPFIASASDLHVGSLGAYTAFNLDTSKPYITPDNKGVGTWVQIDLGQILKINIFEIYARNHSSWYVQAPKSVVFEYHNGDGIWKSTENLLIDKMISQTDFKSIALNVKIEAKVLRIKTTSLHAGNNNVSIGAIKIGFLSNDKILIKNDTSYVYYGQNNTWETLPNEPTVQDFLDYGMDELTDAQIQDFESQFGKQYRIYRWTDGDAATSAKLKAVPQPQLVLPNGDISITGVEMIDQLTLTGNGDVRVAVSFDSGLTWNAHDGSAWQTVADASQGMDITTINSLTGEQLDEVRGESNFIRFSYYLNGKEAETDHLTMSVTMTGYEQPASPNDWSYTYDQATKKIVYNITKSGTYTIKYLDV